MVPFEISLPNYITSQPPGIAVSLVVSERLVLFYAQSGAGKSSILNARLIPQLREEARYLVLPTGRVAGELQAGVADVANIYVYNLILSLEQNTDRYADNSARFAQMELKDFMAGLYTPDGEHYSYHKCQLKDFDPAIWTTERDEGS